MLGRHHRVVPVMSTYTVTFDISLPDGVTPEDAEEFIRFCIGDRGDCALDNPLAFDDLASHGVTNVDVSES